VARSGSEGFTLIEVLVAFTLLSLVLAITFGGLRLGARAWQSGEEAVERVEEFHTTYALLRRFVARAYPLTWGDALADRRFAFVGEEDSFSFVALFPSYPSLPGPQLVTVETEESDEGESLRLRWKPFEPDEDETRDADPVEDHILVEAPVMATFAYFGDPEGGEDRDWRDSWEAETAFPQLVRLSVVPSDGRVPWPDLVLPVAIDMDVDCLFDGEEPVTLCRRDER